MLQTVLMFLASPQNEATTERRVDRPVSRMATRAKPAVAQCHAEGRNESRNESRAESRAESRDEGLVTWLAVVGNALGFVLLMTGLWLVLRLVETLLG